MHYRWSWPEFVQALIMFVVSLGMIPLLQEYLGLLYDVALAFVFVCGIGFMLPALLGVPHVPGWITAAIPVVLLFLGDFEPGPEAIQALVALKLLVFGILFLLGITGFGSIIVRRIPNSLKGGILIGAGIVAVLEEIEAGGRLAEAPISLIIGSLIALYILFSLSFRNMYNMSSVVRFISNYGIVPAIVVAIGVGWAVREYPLPDVEIGIAQSAVLEMWGYLPFTVGFPGLDLFALPLVSTFQPVLPIALSLTLILTGYISITIGIEQLGSSVERGVAGIMAVVLAVQGAALGLLAGVVLYLLIERRNPLSLPSFREGSGEEPDPESQEEPEKVSR